MLPGAYGDDVQHITPILGGGAISMLNISTAPRGLCPSLPETEALKTCGSRGFADNVSLRNGALSVCDRYECRLWRTNVVVVHILVGARFQTVVILFFSDTHTYIYIQACTHCDDDLTHEH